MLQEQPNIGETLARLNLEARVRQGSLHRQWIKASIALSGRLTRSALMASIQRDGEIDMLIRSIEDEIAGGKSNLDDPLLSPVQSLLTLSNYWISSVYEALRLLRARERLENTAECVALFRAIELVRITIDKHEIANERHLKEPLELARTPAKGDATDVYVYNRNDSARAHIMPTGLSPRGSVVWQPVDVKSQSDQPIERRWVSEQIIAIWGR
jgi:hypothetical protein